MIHVLYPSVVVFVCQEYLRSREVDTVILEGFVFGAADGAVASELNDLLVCAPDISVVSGAHGHL